MRQWRGKSGGAIRFEQRAGSGTMLGCGGVIAFFEFYQIAIAFQ